MLLFSGVLYLPDTGRIRVAHAQQGKGRNNPKKPQPKEEPKEEPKKEEPKEEPKKEELPPKGATQGGVLDFCKMAPKENKDKFVKQRVVLFGLGGQEMAEGEEQGVDPENGAPKSYHVFKDIEIMKHLNEVFLSVLPMPRFFFVVAERLIH